MNKVLLVALLLALAPKVFAEPEPLSQMFVHPVHDVLAGDFTTRIPMVDPGDNTTPWAAKDLSTTVLVLGTAIDTTATAVTFDIPIPNDYEGNGALYIQVKPAAADTDMQLNTRIQLQGVWQANPTTVTTQVWGTASTVLAAADLDNLTTLKMKTTAFNAVKRNQTAHVYLYRDAGTTANLYIHKIFFGYKPKFFSHR